MKFTLAFVTLCALALENEAGSAPSDAGWIKPKVAVRPGAKASPGVINGQIVGGTKATAGQIPYQVNLHIDCASLCGGSLISKRWVLTAAHCLVNRTYAVIRMGTLNWQLPTETNRVTLVSTALTVHANYSSSTYLNDIALIQLSSDAPLNTFINIIALPKYSDATKTYAGFTATASGWGRIADNGTLSNDLLWANMPVVNNTVCQQTYGSLIVSSTICTSGANTKSTCRGDSGGPLTVVDVTKKLVGVVSFGAQSCQSGYPQAYTRVTSYLAWINQKTGIVISA